MSTSSQPRIFITGATGELGALVLDQLLATVASGEIAVGVRVADDDRARKLAAKGVQVRVADYDRPETLATAFAGVERLLFISSNSLDRRPTQHRALIDAAVQARVGFVAYTSLLHADVSPLGLAADHRATEAMLAASGLPYALLRNGWYTENYMASVAPALAHHAFVGSARDGRISSASRADYAAAAAAVVRSNDDLAGRVFELAGDTAYTLSELAQELSHQSAETVPYVDLPMAEYRSALVGAGLPADVATLLADSDAGAAEGALFDEGRQLGALLGRPTTPLASSIAETLRALGR
jgi:NAD(P)H dehydrogenase (quinone)